VVFVEEPVFDADKPALEQQLVSPSLVVVVPHLPHNLSQQEQDCAQQQLLQTYFKTHQIRKHIAWYYTPMSLGFSRSFQPVLTVYDCMDELTAFKNAPAGLKEREEELFSRADLVFTGGYSLFKSKRQKHPEVFLLPSSIDKDHFSRARQPGSEPFEQSMIPHPRMGFFGVIDERMDIDLVDQLAVNRPDWHFVFIGPVVKISPDSLPTHTNLHFLGARTYDQLPEYIAHWDLAIMPFAINEATRFISPTKTPEYLAAGKPVVSTPIHDVIHDYGKSGLVSIAGTPDEFGEAIENILKQKENPAWLNKVDLALQQTSWDNCVQKIVVQLHRKLEEKKMYLKPKKENDYV